MGHKRTTENCDTRQNEDRRQFMDINLGQKVPEQAPREEGSGWSGGEP